MVRIYKRRNFNIYSDYNGNYVIHNTRKEFSQGHTHINNFHTAKYVVDMAIRSSIPKKHISKYLVISIIRVSTDPSYIDKLRRIYHVT